MSIPRSLTISQKNALHVEFYTKTVERSDQKMEGSDHETT